MDRTDDIRDIPLMIWVVPWFGIFIPNLTGLFGPLGVYDQMYWVGYPCFIILAYAIWWGNRWLYLRQRRHFDWFSRPASKIITVLFANIFYTAPVTLLGCWGWYRLAGLPLDWEVVKDTCLFNVIAVIFITHVYETAFLIRDRESDLLRLANLERSRALAELEALKNQVDPHFMFNSLNTLSHLVATNRALAQEFIEKLADVYRYILHSKQKDLVLVREELHFLNNYYGLLRLRFGDSIRLNIGETDEGMQFLPPISLQVLLENAVKHNEFDELMPLHISIGCQAGVLSFMNTKRAKAGGGDHLSTGIGLKNLNNRFQLIVDKPIRVLDGAEQFVVHLPLVAVG